MKNCPDACTIVYMHVHVHTHCIIHFTIAVHYIYLHLLWCVNSSSNNNIKFTTIYINKDQYKIESLRYFSVHNVPGGGIRGHFAMV